MDRGAWWATVHGAAKWVRHDGATNTFITILEISILPQLHLNQIKQTPHLILRNKKVIYELPELRWAERQAVLLNEGLMRKERRKIRIEKKSREKRKGQESSSTEWKVWVSLLNEMFEFVEERKRYPVRGRLWGPSGSSSINTRFKYTMHSCGGTCALSFLSGKLDLCLQVCAQWRHEIMIPVYCK